MKVGKSSYLSFLFILSCLVSFSKADEVSETMKNYCVVPPFMEIDTKPNILLVMDFAGSM